MNLKIGVLFLSAIFGICSESHAQLPEFENHLVSPKGSFSIRQGADVAEQKDLLFQAWIYPEKSARYRLESWHDGEISWAGRFTISPNERWILQIQKTGSGDNYGAVFGRNRSGRFQLQDRPSEPCVSEKAFKFFEKVSHLEAKFYHAGVEFISWGDDGECLEISLHGHDLAEAYLLDDWRLHYNLVSKQFFLTRDQVAHNRGAIILK